MKTRKKEISKNQLKIVFGIFISVLAIVLFINQFIVTRVLSFVPAYLLGFGSYLLYICLYAIGFKMTFIKNKIVLKHKVILAFGIIFLIIGAFGLATHIDVMNTEMSALKPVSQIKILSFVNDGANRVNFFETYNQVFNCLTDGYLKTDNINFFANNYSVGGGLFGYALLACGNTLFNSVYGGLVISIIAIVISLLFFVLPIIIFSTKKNKQIKMASREAINASNENVEEKIERFASNYNTDEVNASEVEDDEETFDSSMNENKSFDLDTMSDAANGTFIRPVFTLDDNKQETVTVETPEEPQQSQSFAIAEDNADSVAKKIPADFYNDNPFLEETASQEEDALSVEEEQEEIQPIGDETISPTPIRQLDESLVQAKTHFAETNDTGVVQPAQTAQIVTSDAINPLAPVYKKQTNAWVPPSPDMLDVAETAEQQELNNRTAEERKNAINGVLSDFGIGAHVIDYVVGASVTRFNISYEPHVTQKQVANIISDISIRLGGISARFVPIVEGQSSSGLEIPNAETTKVTFKETVLDLPDVKKHPLAVAFGKNISGQTIWADFNEFPHLLVAGTTGSGKSVFVNSIISTLIMRNSPDDLKIILVDPKTVEMTRYKDMPHLLRPIIYTAEDALRMARKLQEEMERRYKLFGESNSATNIKEYNQDAAAAGKDKLPYILFILDEYADLIDNCKELSLPVVSLAQKARACGIHLMISTQRPSTNVVTGTIKANLPTHVALMCSSSTDSITIIGEGGAEKLLGYGDMLVQSPLVSRVGVVRLQGCFASRGEMGKIVNYLKEHYETYYDPYFLKLEEEADEKGAEYVNSAEFQSSKEGSEEDRYQAIKEWAMTQEYMSISRIQRECSVGFNRAGRFFLRMQQEGIVDSKVDGNKGCKVLVQDKFGADVDIGSDEQSYFREDD